MSASNGIMENYGKLMRKYLTSQGSNDVKCLVKFYFWYKNIPQSRYHLICFTKVKKIPPKVFQFHGIPRTIITAHCIPFPQLGRSINFHGTQKYPKIKSTSSRAFFIKQRGAWEKGTRKQQKLLSENSLISHFSLQWRCGRLLSKRRG